MNCNQVRAIISPSQHLAEVIFPVVEFVNEFQQDDELVELWNVAPNSDFCTWAGNYIYSQPVILNLVACLPYNANRKYMPWLNVRIHSLVLYSIF